MTALAEAFGQQARACAALGSPFMERLLTTLADIWPETGTLAETCAAWRGDIGPGGASLPLRIAGGLHALVLSGQSPALTAAYPGGSGGDLAGVLRGALRDHQPFLLAWIARPPQTNEVRRSAALIPAAHLIAARFDGLPFHTSELGASAGLNLMWDRYALDTPAGRLGPAQPALTLRPEWSGPLPPPAEVTVAAHAGVDLTPLDMGNAGDRLRALAYLWPDQPERAALTRAAMAALQVRVEAGDAIDWLATRLAARPEGRIHLIYHTIAWQYFPAPAQARGRTLIEAAGADATRERPLAWLSLENDGNDRGAALRLRLWPGAADLLLARVDFHGRWVDWRAA